MTEATITVPPRSQVPAEFTWNGPSVFESRQAWEAETKRIQESLPAIEKFKGHLGDSPKTLADGLEKIDDLVEAVGKVIVYSGMSAAVDTTDQAAQAMDSRANGLFGQVLAAISFANPEMIKIGQDKLRQWMKQEPRLAIYEHAIDDLFRTQAHVRSEEVEEILGMVQDPFST